MIEEHVNLFKINRKKKEIFCEKANLLQTARDQSAIKNAYISLKHLMKVLVITNSYFARYFIS